MLKRIGLLLLALVLVLSMMTGCGTKDTDDKDGKPSGDGGNAADVGGDEIVVNVGPEPESIDPTLNNAVDGANIIIHAFEGLTKLDKDGKVIPGMAERWDMSSDGTKFTFYLRDAKWSDGKPVTAHDFVYSWRRAVNPATAAEYSYQLFYIKNGQAINEGAEGVKLEDLGVKAIDEKTLEVTLEAPIAYFLEITSFPTLFPLREDIVEANPDTWTNDPKTYVSNGPFKMQEWSHDEQIVLVKNEDYYDKDTILPSSIKFMLMSDDNAILAAFRNDELMLADSMPTEEIPALKAEGVLKIDPQLGTYFIVFNTTKAPFDNPKVRKAFSLAIDRQYIIDNIAQGGQIPAGAYVPYGIPDVNASPDFRTVGGNYYDPSASAYEANVKEAQKLLAEAGYPNGEGFPAVEYIFNTGGAHQQIAEAMQEMWKNNLGVSVKLTSQEWAVFEETRNVGAFQFARHGWLGDYVDPMTFLDMWTSNSGQNNARWKNAEFDSLIQTAKTSADRAERVAAMHKAEDLFMNDAAVAPIYFYTDMYLIKDYLKGFYGSPLGFKYFMYSYVEQ